MPAECEVNTWEEPQAPLWGLKTLTGTVTLGEVSMTTSSPTATPEVRVAVVQERRWKRNKRALYMCVHSVTTQGPIE